MLANLTAWARNFAFSFRLVFATKRGLLAVVSKALVVFGFISAVAGFWAAVTAPMEPLAHIDIVFASAMGSSLLVGVISSWPRATTSQEYQRPEMKITVKRGDIFDQKGQLVVGFSDTFDTDTTDDVIISSKSIQGQLVTRLFDGDATSLDQLMSEALKTIDGKSVPRREKPQGKTRRYPIGTTAAIRKGQTRVYCVAYSRMRNDLVAQSSMEDFWQSLGKLWDEVYRHGQHKTVVLPIMGSELARIECLDRESLIRTILLSFVARSREQLLCKELVLVVHPDDATKVNMLEVAAFMRTL